MRGRTLALFLATTALLVTTAVSLRDGWGWHDLRPPERGQLSSSARTPEAVVRRLLQYLAQEKEEEIRAMGVSKQEFARFIWKQLPVSRPGTNLSLDFVWNHGYVRSQAQLARMLSTHSGRDYEFFNLRFLEGTKDYGTFKIHKDARVLVKESEGRQKELNLFGSILEIDGEFKIYDFNH